MFSFELHFPVIRSINTVLSQEEITLLTGLARGDSQSFKQLFDVYHTRLYHLSFRMLRDSEKAKDAVQEVLIKVWHNREKLSVTTSLEAYLKRAVVNTTLNVMESEKRRVFLSVFSAVTASLVDKQKPEHIDDGGELQRSIDKAILSLPPRTRAVFVLVRMEDMSYDQVSESLNISNKAVEKEMMKALKLLRNQLRHFLAISFIPTLGLIFS